MGKKSEGLAYSALRAQKGSHQLPCLRPGAGRLNYLSLPTVSLDGRSVMSKLTTTATGKTS